MGNPISWLLNVLCCANDSKPGDIDGMSSAGIDPTAPLCAVLDRLPKAHLPSVANATHPPLQTRMWTPSSLATSGRTTAFCHRAPSSSKTGTSSWCAEAPSFPCPEPPPYALPLIAHEACRGFFRAGRLRARWPCDFLLGQSCSWTGALIVCFWSPRLVVHHSLPRAAPRG